MTEIGLWPRIQRGKLPWWALLALPSWKPVFMSRHCSPFVERTPVDFIYRSPIFTWNQRRDLTRSPASWSERCSFMKTSVRVMWEHWGNWVYIYIYIFHTYCLKIVPWKYKIVAGRTSECNHKWCRTYTFYKRNLLYIYNMIYIMSSYIIRRRHITSPYNYHKEITLD